LLGLRHVPGRLALAVFRIPAWLYRCGWGWMLGRTFLLVVHVGRASGRILGWGDLRDDRAVHAFVRRHPFVAFRHVTPRSMERPSSAR
jgi:hypothetical protein